jgi:Asp-tRNA(Asn)/Glu-tRNA(Gln) amidotransferase A subunit family amidase
LSPTRLSATEASAAIAAGKLTSEALVADCLERIAKREEEVRAWVFIDPQLALKQARQCDREPPKSRLHGIPIGVKDVIDTCDMPTEYGSPIYRGHRPVCDAACVAQIRELGGVILGKTVSTEFATRHPNKTRNPRNLEHTPGGSSSGSAAAVAEGMVPIAFGTQTSSSIIRPAAFCGVIGYKPTFGLINRAGLKFLAESLDTIGTLTRTIPDAAWSWKRLPACRRPRSTTCPHLNHASDSAARRTGIAPMLRHRQTSSPPWSGSPLQARTWLTFRCPMNSRRLPTPRLR